MPNHIKLAALLGLVVAHDIRTQIRTVKAARVFNKAVQAYEETEAMHTEQIHYLCHIIEKNEISVDEFDLIALRYNA